MLALDINTSSIICQEKFNFSFAFREKAAFSKILSFIACSNFHAKVNSNAKSPKSGISLILSDKAILCCPIFGQFRSKGKFQMTPNGYIPNQYRHLIRKMFLPSSVKLLRNRWNGRNSKSSAPTSSNAIARD